MTKRTLRIFAAYVRDQGLQGVVNCGWVNRQLSPIL